MIEDRFISTVNIVNCELDHIELKSNYFDMDGFERDYSVFYSSPEIRTKSEVYELDVRVISETFYQNSDLNVLKENLSKRELNSIQHDLFQNYFDLSSFNRDLPLTKWESFLNRKFGITKKFYVDETNVDYYIAKLSNRIIDLSFNRPNFIIVDRNVLDLIKRNSLFVFADKNRSDLHITFEGSLNGFAVFLNPYMLKDCMIMGCSNSVYLAKGESNFVELAKEVILTTKSKIANVNPNSKLQFSSFLLDSSKKPLWRKLLKI